MNLTPEQIAELRQMHSNVVHGTDAFSIAFYTQELHESLPALLDAAEELGRIKRVAATGTAENFANLPGSALREFFAVHLEESERLKRAQIALLDAAEREAKLRAFAIDVMACWPHGDVDGGDLQEIAERHGLLRPETRTQPCDDEPNRCHCLEYGGRDEFPLVCYRKTELLTETRCDAPERSQWRPIESAPTDCTTVLLCGQTPDGCWWTETGFWSALNEAWVGGHFEKPVGVPKLWMPLPQPPELHGDALDEMASLNQQAGLYDSPKPEGRGDE